MGKANPRRDPGRPATLSRVSLLTLTLMLAAAASSAAERPAPRDDLTFRPTVLVRNGSSQGSGTIIASTEGETLVLTASHVVEEPGSLSVELHRYNLGVEHAQSSRRWPLSFAAKVAAADVAADVAILRVRGLGALPYVARLG